MAIRLNPAGGDIFFDLATGGRLPRRDARPPMISIQVKQLTKQFGSIVALHGLDLTINPVVVDSVTEYHADYVLIYSKNDSIRKVTGSNVLI